jgi:hypothetical protein
MHADAIGGAEACDFIGSLPGGTPDPSPGAGPDSVAAVS